MQFDIYLKETKDTLIMSYNQETMEKLPREMASDLLYILKEKHSYSNKFFEFNPSEFANELLNRKSTYQFAETHNTEFNIFKKQVIKSILFNANKNESDFYTILSQLYQYENVISHAAHHENQIQYKINNFELSFKDISVLNELPPTLAVDFPSYLVEFLNYDHAVKNNNKLPPERIFSLSTETKKYLYENFHDKVKEESNKFPFSMLTFFVKCHIHNTCQNANDIFNTLKVIASIDQELLKDLSSNLKKNRP